MSEMAASEDDLRPHLFEGELELMSRTMRGASSYLEFGTGGSCLLAARSGIRRIVSGDSDESWLRKVAAKAASQRLENTMELVLCDIGPISEWGYPADETSKSKWANYLVAPWRTFLARGGIPDLIYIDGRFRVACALYSILMLSLVGRRFFRRKSRIMIHDFCDRPHYHKVMDYASVVTKVNTLAVLEATNHYSRAELVQDLLSFQFDPR